MEKITHSKVGIIVSEAFQVSLITYLILLLLETVRPGFVSNFFNLNYLLWVVLTTGFMKILPFSRKKELTQWEMIDIGFMKVFEQIKKTSINENEFYFIVFVGVGGAGLTYLKTQDLGQVSLLIALVTFIVIFLLAYLVLTDAD